MTATVAGVSATAGTGGPGPLAPWPVNGSNTVALPTSTGAPLAGDLILLPIYVRNGAQTIDTTSGYTRLSGDNDTGSNVTAEIQAKIAGGSESNPTVTDSQTATQPTAAVALTIRGWSGSLAGIVVSAPNIGGSSTIPFPDATAAVGDSLVLRIAMQGDDNNITTPPAGHTQLFFEQSGSGSDALLAIYSQDAPAAAGSVGTANLVVSGSDPYAAYTVVIPPGGDPFDVLADTFDDVSGLWPNSYGGTAVTGGQAVIDCDTGQFSGFKSATRYTLADSYVGGEFFPPAANGGSSAYMAVIATSSTAGTDAAFNIDGGFMGLLLREGFSDPDAEFITYDPDAHAWLRFLEDGGLLFWESSPNGADWTALRTEASPAWVDDRDLAFIVECKRADGSDNTGSFDNANTFGEPGGEPETVELAAVLPALTGAVTVDAVADAAMSATLPALTGSAAVDAHVELAVAGTLPMPTAAIGAAAAGTAQATMAAVLPAMSGSISANSLAETAFAGALPMLVAALNIQQPGVEPTRAFMDAAVAAIRTADPSVTAVREAAPAATAARTQTSAVAAARTQTSGVS